MQAYSSTSRQRCKALSGWRHPAPGHGVHYPSMGQSPMADSEVMLVTETDDASKMPIRILKVACGLLLWGWVGLFLCTPTPAVARPATTIFESGQVRPLALSHSGKLLFAVNTPDNRLEIFAVRPRGLRHRASVSVGLEPVAVAARTDDEVWVVNHLSDSVSIVDIDHGSARGRVVRTLLVGDEPRDIVFAGPGKNEPSLPRHIAARTIRTIRS